MELAATARSSGRFTKRRPITTTLLAVGGVVASLAAMPFWLIFLVPSLPICASAWYLARRRVQWTKFDFAILVVPYLAWLALVAEGTLSKSMSNAVIEPIYLGLAVGLAPIIRIAFPKRWNAKIVAATLLVAASAVGVGIYFSVPCLPE